MSSCSGERNRNPLLIRWNLARIAETSPTNGSVNRLIKKITTATVMANGNKIASPVRKYFFIFSFFSVRGLFFFGEIFLRKDPIWPLRGSNRSRGGLCGSVCPNGISNLCGGLTEVWQLDQK